MLFRLRSIWFVIAACVLCPQRPVAGQITLYVDDDAPTGGDGFSWDTAYTYLRDALSFAAYNGGVSEIRIGQGVYKPDADAAHPNGTGSVYVSFAMLANVAIRGGYAGVGAADPDARDFNAFESILSGDLAGNDDEGDNSHNDNSRSVATSSGVSGGGLLEGLTVTAGKSGQYLQGGALSIANSSPVIRSCTIRHNYQSVAIYGLNTDIEIHDSQFIENEGNGIAIGGTSHPVVAQCMFVANTSAGMSIYSAVHVDIDGCSFIDHINSGLHVDEAEVAISNCVFAGNSVGIWADGSPSTSVASSHFENHSATAIRLNSQSTTVALSDCDLVANTGVGAVYNLGGDYTAKNCTFDGNVALHANELGNGGAIYNYAGTCTLKDCVLQNNYALNGGAVYNRLSATCRAVNCLFQDNYAEDTGGAVCSVPYYADTLSSSTFTGCVFFRNEAGIAGGAICSERDDLKLTNCTLVQNAALFGAGLHHKTTSIVRVYNSIIRNNYGSPIGGHGQRTVRYSNISGGHPGIGNINVNPKFVDYVSGDVRLRPGSTCIDAGRNSYLPASVTTDIDGDPRFLDDPNTPDSGVGRPPIVDMGAHEFQP